MVMTLVVPLGINRVQEATGVEYIEQAVFKYCAVESVSAPVLSTGSCL